MKIRRRKYKISEKKENYWPSFVDAMTATTLVFFFIMILSIGMISIFSDDIAKNRKEVYELIEKSLDEMGISKDIMAFNREEGKIEIYSETTFEKNGDQLKEDGIVLTNQLSNLFLNLFQYNEKIPESIDYIEVIGHTDFAGDTLYGRNLSTRRASEFVNKLVPMNSRLESEFGNKFKASGMSEFESYNTKENKQSFKEIIARNDSDYNEHDEKNKAARKIELRIIFNNDELEKMLGERVW